jgi:formamidase
MAGTTHYVKIDKSKTLAEEPHTGHNRWHEDIPPIVTVDPGDTVVLEARDAWDSQFNKDTTNEDVGRATTDLVHPHTGPVYVRDAEPGDLLEVRIGQTKCARWGYTVQVPGFGFLRGKYTAPHITKWDIADNWATSEQIPGIRIPGAPFMGSMGVAPSASLRETYLRREAELLARGGAVNGPQPAGAVPSDPAIAEEALRTIPPREIAGNIDVKQLTAGTTMLIPVATEGALFSVGDAHFAQGDGEVCGTAIEVAATFTAELHLRRGEAKRRGVQGLQFFRDSFIMEPKWQAPKRFYATTGLPIRADGTNESEDTSLAAANALHQMIAYLGDEWGYDEQQAYTICSVAVDLKISELVDVPNFIVTAVLPLDIFI